jgi:hypothetical protein|nr:MAG TPA: hypothetical protein [Caudoviricetes sp.]
MKDKKIKKILEAMNGVSLQEWKNLKSYFDNKFYLNKKFENNELAFKTIKIFFNSNQESSL